MAQTYQRPVTELAKTRPSPQPFIQGTPVFSSSTAQLLNDTIPELGPSGPPTIAPPAPPQAVEEQYEYAERRKFSTSTTPQYYDLLTQNPKEILIIAETVDHYVEFNRQIDDDSPKVFSSGSLSLTAKGITRVWYQATSGTGSIYIIVFKR